MLIFYYKISILGSPLEPLTYSSDQDISTGIKVSITLNSKDKFGVVTELCEEPAFKTLEISSITEFHYSHEQLSISKFISSYYFSSLGEALSLFLPYKKNIEPLESSELKLKESINLSPKQNDALSFLKENKVSLLFGDTGSGKTEIYMKYFEQMMIDKKTSIFLMPEISLTPQMQIRLEKHFGSSVVMWHSKLTKKQKEKILDQIYKNKVSIVAGPRSTLFLPLHSLGLIVVDEEHDDSYKSSSRPRYSARDMAIFMGKKLNIPVLLGSATPSLSSYVKFPHVRLKGGHFKSERKFIYEEHVEAITPKVESLIEQTKEKNEQSMLFIPTRANFKYLICEACGFTYECPFCSVGMSLHSKNNLLKCHYCNYVEPITKTCPKCHNGELVSSRIGTAEAVSYFHEHSPSLRVGQFDRDIITTQKKLKELLRAFNEKEIDLLIGTQMLSKGHDYHDVSLAVIFGIDNILNMSDYRSREKALSLLIQIAGRSGRKNSSKVLIQTFNAEFFSQYLETYEDFLEDEKLFRKGLYPPYKKLARVLFAHKTDLKAQSAMREMESILKNISTISIVGSGKAPIEKIANKFRYQILLRSDKSTDLIKAIKMSQNALAEIDMDPIEFG